jgi:hypothetical protein
MHLSAKELSMVQASYLKELNTAKKLYFLENAIITPTSMDEEKRTFTGCVYDQSGNIFSVSQRTNRNVAWKPMDPDSLPAGEIKGKMIDGRCIYLGHYSGHYGHFLLETLSRFWVFCDGVDYDKVIFQPFIHETPSPHSYPPARVSFECFNIKSNQLLMVDRLMMFRHLIVPTALVEVNNQSNEEQILVYRQIAEYCERNFHKRGKFLHRFFPKQREDVQRNRLYLSRRRLKSPHFMVNEDEVEKLFTGFGFTIIYPETLSFQEQVVLYKQAQVLAGFAGSALHNSVFMMDNALVISLGDVRRPNDSHPNQKMCDGLSKVQSVFVKFTGTVVDQQRRIGKFDISFLRSQLEELLESLNND